MKQYDPLTYQHPRTLEEAFGPVASREEFELEHFGISPGKIGQKHHAAKPYPPSHWRRTFKGWVLLALGWVLGTLFGVMLVLVWEMTK